MENEHQGIDLIGDLGSIIDKSLNSVAHQVDKLRNINEILG